MVTLTFSTNDDKTRGRFVCLFFYGYIEVHERGKEKVLEESEENG